MYRPICAYANVLFLHILLLSTPYNEKSIHYRLSLDIIRLCFGQCVTIIFKRTYLSKEALRRGLLIGVHCYRPNQYYSDLYLRYMCVYIGQLGRIDHVIMKMLSIGIHTDTKLPI